MFLLVFLYEGVSDLASFFVHLGAHGVCMASNARVFPPQARLAPGGWFVFYQPFFYQHIPSHFKNREVPIPDATFEKATLFSTGFGEFGLLL